MRSISFIFLVILVTTGTYTSSLGLAQDDNEFPLRQTELARLAKGEVIIREDQSSDRGGRKVQAAILIDSPVQRVWNVIIDCERAPEFMPDLKSCKFLQRSEDTAIIEQEVKVSRLLPKTTYIYRAIYQKFRRIDFKRISGDLKDLEGSWVLERVEGGQQTIVVYSVVLDPGFFAPKWLVRQILRRNLPDVLLALRKWVSDSPSSK